MNSDEIKSRTFEIIDSSREELISFLREYIQHRSINPERQIFAVENGETTACQKWLHEALRSLGCFETVTSWSVSSGELNVAARLPATEPDGYQSALFNGHSDVVPVTAAEYASWQGGDPWSGQVHGGAVYGRGACDMKGGNSSVIWAARCLSKAGFVPKGRMTLTFTIGEESGNADLGPYSVKQQGYSGDVVVVAEPTNLNVCPAAVGWFFFRVDAIGKASHAASRSACIYPSAASIPPGVNAIEVLLPVIERFGALERDWGVYEKHPLMQPGNATMNIVKICGGAEQATTPTSCHAVWAVVVSPNRRCSDVRDQIARVLESANITNSWLRQNPAQMTSPYLQGYFEPVNTPVTHPACVPMLKAVRATGLDSAEFACMPTPSDANFFAEHGQPVIICGPGNLLGNGVHGLDEHIEIDSLLSAAKAYAGFIVDYSSVPKIERP
jgi:acetylornithine deacetylase/succinyl-diaminopimelate desuccinylase-like protein